MITMMTTGSGLAMMTDTGLVIFGRNLFHCGSRNRELT
jgi:hypothetical protein